MIRVGRIALAAGAALPLLGATPAPIDRHALVERHAIVQSRIDRHAPVMLGNGSLGFTADITGLQTFPEQYAPQSPLLTMAQWAWHSSPNPKGYTEADGLVQVPVPGRGTQPYAYMRDLSEAKSRPALAWLRENPHRISLGRVSLAITGRDGAPARFDQIHGTEQRLDLWTGALTSRFTFEGAPVTVETRVDAARDVVLVSVRSGLVAAGRLAVDVRYPGVSPTINPDPSDWSQSGSHRTAVASQAADAVRLRRTVDATRYQASLQAPGGRVSVLGQHRYRASAPGRTELRVLAGFEQVERPLPRADYRAAVAGVSEHWRLYWSTGGAIDFSGSTDPRAAELERRVVLSQYLAAINQAGDVPPQEEGLFSNSWNGKFHLEMHAWHEAHFAQWGRPGQLERSMGWYLAHLPQAEAEARLHRVDGAWWPKMSGPEGRNSPSPINPFIMWQQPHPIYLAEMLYRAHPDRGTLARYARLVDRTAALLASWPRGENGRFVLGPPIIPVQENHPALSTVNPAFELAYFRWALGVAQQWRERQGLRREASWDRVMAGLAPLPMRDGLYLPVESAPDFWSTTMSAVCDRKAIAPPCLNRDHPSFLMAYGLIADPRVDRAAMSRTLDAVRRHWDIRQTWGWDFPMMAMTAARLGRPDDAVAWLFEPAGNNQWGTTGMTPRVDVEVTGPADRQGLGTRRLADTYFPSNGALLLAVGMMAAGWDGSTGHAPGFPKQGWTVRAEGVRPLP